MRYYELANELGVESEDLTQAVAERFEKAPVALSKVEAEAEAYLRERFGKLTSAPSNEGEKVNQDEDELLPLEPGPGEQVLEVDPSSSVPGEVLETEPEADRSLVEDAEAAADRAAENAISALDEATFVAKYGVDAEEYDAIQAGLEVTPPEDRFPVVDPQGNYVETLKLDPGLARRVEAVLAGRPVEGYRYDLEARCFYVITAGQKYRLALDE